MIAHTVVNALAIVSGIVCDGAKASCAAKIATAVEAGIFGYNMYIRGQELRRGWNCGKGYRDIVKERWAFRKGGHEGNQRGNYKNYDRGVKTI